MAIISSTTVLVYIPVACLFLANCKNEPLKVDPTVSTSPPTNITANSALVSSNISSDGGSKVSSRGVCWSTSANPTTVNSKITDGTGTGVFTSSISGLSPDMRYHVRAYATNSMGTSYGDDITFTTNGPNTDADGNTYSTVTIGTQVWMASNLKTTKYKDGTAIPLVIDNVDWSNISTPGYCWYNNNEAAIKNTYGALYNWYAVNTGIFCPTGWHVPTVLEWRTVGSFLGGE